MFYLSIESSCDETSLAILEYEKNGKLDFYSSINSIKVISSIISSQIETHKLYGGVVPEIGARLHAEQIHGLYKIVLDQALEKLELSEIDFYKQMEVIFVTAEPGLMSALRVGIEFGKSLKFYVSQNFVHQVEIQNVNHLQGHIASSFFKLKNISHNTLKIKQLDEKNSPFPKRGGSEADGVLSITETKGFEGGNTDLGNDFQNAVALATSTLTNSTASNNGLGSFALDKMKHFKDSQIFPHLHLMVSGGNTQIRLLRSWSDWEIIGQTIDDAAGECFDKAARMVGIPYPGGATLSKIAGDEYFNPLSLPIAMINSGNLDISLSGLKTAVRYKIEKTNIQDLKLDEPLTESEITELKSQNELENNPKLQFIKQLCISTQYAIIEQLVRKVNSSVKQYQPNSFGISGGVSANGVLKSKIQELESIQKLEIKKLFTPDLTLTGDNAVMIGLAGLISKFR
jgi:glycoprotease/Kae1 family metallohydrolase